VTLADESDEPTESSPTFKREAVVEVCSECSVEKVWRVTRMYVDDAVVAERRAAKRDSVGRLLAESCINLKHRTPTELEYAGEPVEFRIIGNFQTAHCDGVRAFLATTRDEYSEIWNLLKDDSRTYTSSFNLPETFDESFFSDKSLIVWVGCIIGGGNSHTVDTVFFDKAKLIVYTTTQFRNHPDPWMTRIVILVEIDDDGFLDDVTVENHHTLLL
jgi:hypothetical protein